MTEHGARMVTIGKLPPQTAREQAEKPPSWIESPVVVLPALFLVFGPLALPMLWMSRRFTRGWKIGLTVAVLLLTVAACWYTAVIVMKTLEPLSQDIAVMGLSRAMLLRPRPPRIGLGEDLGGTPCCNRAMAAPAACTRAAPANGSNSTAMLRDWPGPNLTTRPICFSNDLMLGKFVAGSSPVT